jgi:acyl-CoA dehydrogenase
VSVTSPYVYFTAEHESFRRSVRSFLEKEIAPHAPDWERRREMPRSAWLAFAAEGLLGLNHSRTIGGAEKDFFSSVVFLEELGRTGFGGVRFAVALHSYMATSYLAANGSPDLQRRYLAPAVAGEMISALAITEPQAGSDLTGLAATAREDGGTLIVDGEKRFIVNGCFADFFVTTVRTDGLAGPSGHSNLSLCVIDRHSEGVNVMPNDCIAWRASGMADLSFRGVRVPTANLIGRRNSGFTQIMKNMQLERLAAAITAVGDAANCLNLTWRFLSRRGMFSATLSAKQAVRHRMAELLTELEAARQLVYHAAWQYARAPLSITECSMAKLRATELAKLVAEECQHLHGAEGYRENSRIARIVQDAQAATVAAGASEVMRDIIARSGYEEAS